MTTELEKQFFNTFEIEPKEFKFCGVGTFCPYDNQLCDDTCPYYRTYKVDYPEITDRHYLQLICKLSGVCCPHFAFERDISELKEIILKFCIYYKDQLKQQVQALFKE